MKKLVYACILGAFIISCEKKESPIKISVTTDSLSSETVSKPIETLGAKSYCYIKIVGKDTIVASFNDNLGTITGKLAYKNNEKDSSKGEISGFKSGDTLKLNYEFASEGTTSKRDIFFIQKNNSLFEGIGELKDNGGQMIYANEKKISYPENQKFELADCNKVNQLLK